jgi:hypothetical protein
MPTNCAEDSSSGVALGPRRAKLFMRAICASYRMLAGIGPPGDLAGDDRTFVTSTEAVHGR